MIHSPTIRSRESRASAEQEFLSSTSEEVCELWSGRGVVRLTDKTNDMQFLVILHPASSNPYIIEPTFRYDKVWTAHAAYCRDILHIRPSPRSRTVTGEIIEEIILGVPNITVNIRGNILNANELRFWAFFGVLLQSSTLTFPAVATYHWKWLRKGIVVPSFAYGCFLAGSIAVILGIFGCGHIIEGSTTEYTFSTNYFQKSQIQRILMLQMKCTLGAQKFPSFAIWNHSKDTLIRTSTLNNRKFR